MNAKPVRAPGRPNRWIGIAALVAALGAGGWFATRSLATGEPAPDVAYTLLDGSRSTIAAQKGKVLLVNFWSTDCATCMKEMPQIVATHEKFKRGGFETLGVAMSYDPPVYVINYAQSRKLPFGVAIDNTGEIADRFGHVRMTPTSVLIDRQGRIVKRYVGEPDFVALQQLVEKLLAEA